MPEPVSLIALVATAGIGGAATLRDVANRRSGFSDSARYVAHRVSSLVQKNDQAFSTTALRNAVLSDLVDLAGEHSECGWDGAEAPPVSHIASQQARSLILALPAEVPDPELAVDPDDGAIALEWYTGPARVFSVSVGSSTRMACAGIDGTDAWHGVARFDGNKVPEFVLQSIRRVIA